MISREVHGLMSVLAWKDPQAMVSFLLEGGVYERGLELDDELIAPSKDELIEPSKMEDGVLYYVRWNDEPIVLHAGFCVYPHSGLTQRLWRYSILKR